jgi:aspartate aminotransferase
MRPGEPLAADEAGSALERFHELHARGWRRPGGVVDLSFPNPRTRRDDEAFVRLRELAARVEQEQLQYTPFGGRVTARRRVAAALSRRTRVPVGFADVFLTPGATAALVVAVDAFFRTGDEVLVVTPGWMDYELYLLRRGIRPVRAPCGPDKRLNVDAVVDRCGPRTAGVILSQPGCPTGVVHSEESMARLSDALQLAARASGRRIVLLSDEVHRDVVWDGSAPVASPMRLYPQTVSVYSFGKAWSLQGQRTGYLALGPGLRSAADRVRVDRCLRGTGFCAPTTLMQLLVIEMADWVPDQRSLGEDQVRVREALGEIGYEVVAGQATYFVYVRCPHGMDDWSFVELLSRHGVLALPSSVFHEPGYFRLSLNSDRGVLSEAVERLRAAFAAAGARAAG